MQKQRINENNENVQKFVSDTSSLYMVSWDNFHLSHDPDIVGGLNVLFRETGHDDGEGEEAAALRKPVEKEKEEEGGERGRRRRSDPGGPMHPRGE